MNKYRFVDDNKEHLHEININGEWKPLIGTSSVSSVLAKPLTWWSAGLAVMKLGIPDAKVLTKIKNGKATQEEKDTCMNSVSNFLGELRTMNTQDYFKILDSAYRAHQTTLADKAEAGTDMHAELEEYIKMCLSNGGKPMQPKIDAVVPVNLFAAWAIEKVDTFLWSEMYCFSEKLWVGGITDCGYKLKTGDIGIMDFKSSKEAYLSQFWQCSGYDIQIAENGGYDKDGNKIFTLEKPITEYAVFPFGMENPEPQFYHDMTGGKFCFEAEVLLYKALNV